MNQPKLTKSQMKALPKFEQKLESQSHIIQGLHVESNGGNRIRLVASVPGAVGFSPDGSVVFEYTAASHFTHEPNDFMHVDLNHHEDEQIGAIVSSEADIDGNLVVEYEVFPAYSYLVPIILSELNDGHSIEAIILEGRMVTDTRVLVEKYLLTGIAVLFAKPPACDKDICRVLSSNVGEETDVYVTQIVETVKNMNKDELQKSYTNVVAELKRREQSMVFDTTYLNSTITNITYSGTTSGTYSTV